MGRNALPLHAGTALSPLFCCDLQVCSSSRLQMWVTHHMCSCTHTSPFATGFLYKRKMLRTDVWPRVLRHVVCALWVRIQLENWRLHGFCDYIDPYTASYCLHGVLPDVGKIFLEWLLINSKSEWRKIRNSANWRRNLMNILCIFILTFCLRFETMRYQLMRMCIAE
jgi:hypothetical protein